MKIENLKRVFLNAAGCLIFCGYWGATGAKAQEAVNLPAFTGANILILERYPYGWNIASGSNVRTQLFHPLSDRDVIHINRQRDAVAPERVEFVLQAGSLVRWWKGITLYRKITFGRDIGKWRRLQHVFTENDERRSQTISIAVNQLGSTALSFEKAKTFGAHTPMYVIFLDKNRDDLGGQRITFLWEKDN